MSVLCERLYEVDIESQRQAAEAAAPFAPLVTSIIKFLNSSPSTMFICCPEDPVERVKFYAESFEYAVLCCVAVDENLRNSARKLSEKLMMDKEILPILRKSFARPDSKRFLMKFWSLCERHLGDDPEALKFIYDYTRSGLLLVNSIKVRLATAGYTTPR